MSAPTVIDRAARYVSAMGPAVQGQNGSTHTFKVALALVHGFQLNEGDAMAVLSQWNIGCQPEWSVAELVHKVRDAVKATPEKPRGWLLSDRGEAVTTSAPSWPTLHPPTPDHVLRIAELRFIQAEGIQLAADRGLLKVCEDRGQLLWVITDASRLCAQVRTMDGSLISTKAGMTKAKTLPGSKAKHVIGLKESAPFQKLWLVEGGPDLLAAHQFIWQEGRQAEVAAVAVLGASIGIPDDELDGFSGKHVRIVPDADPAGTKGALRWIEALRRVACKVDVLDLSGLVRNDGSPVKDFNGLNFMSPASTYELAKTINPFALCP